MIDEVYSRTERAKPTLNLSAKDLPAIKDWKVGKTYKLMLTVKQTELREGDEWEPGLQAKFKITKVEEC